VKLSEYARQVGVHYRTAWRWFKQGKIRGYQMDTDTIIITEPPPAAAIIKPQEMPRRVAIYARVSATEKVSNLNSQAERLSAYCAARGYQVHKVAKEIGSGINDSRPKLLKLLTDSDIDLIVVEHKDRLTRFGFNYIKELLSMQGRDVEVVNLAGDGKEELMDDLAAIVYSFCARLYGQRRCKRKTEHIISELQADEAEKGDNTSKALSGQPGKTKQA
jgi:predicted site-specific integrase-resolvase